MEQNPQSLITMEGEKIILTCNYTNYSPVTFQWYRKDPERGLVFLLLVRENEGEKQAGRLKVIFDSASKQSSLQISASKPEDSATYFCAADTQSGLVTYFLYTNLIIHS